MKATTDTVLSARFSPPSGLPCSSYLIANLRMKVTRMWLALLQAVALCRCPSLLAEELSSAAEKVVTLSSHTKSRGWWKVRSLSKLI